MKRIALLFLAGCVEVTTGSATSTGSGGESASVTGSGGEGGNGGSTSTGSGGGIATTSATGSGSGGDGGTAYYCADYSPGGDVLMRCIISPEPCTMGVVLTECPESALVGCCVDVETVCYYSPAYTASVAGACGGLWEDA